MKRLAKAAILLAGSAVVYGIGWQISIGFYAIGAWPLGALTRLSVWMFSLWILFWVVRYLIRGVDPTTKRESERVPMREPGDTPT